VEENMTESSQGPRFPNESDAYRAARTELLAAEIELRARIEAVAALRRTLPDGGAVDDYVFTEAAPGRAGEISLSGLFAPGKDSLLVYSYMFAPDAEQPCPMCTSFLDGLERYWPHIAHHVNLAVVAKSPADKLKAWCGNRGWRTIRLLSSFDNTYNRDYMGETPDGGQLPMMNVFTRRSGTVRHFWASEMLFAPSDWDPRHVDLLWPIWHFFDLTPEGRGADWYPQLEY
jgi:predicted dithiol-disulfide oxidoreductase (DUF899 family)